MSKVYEKEEGHVKKFVSFHHSEPSEKEGNRLDKTFSKHTENTFEPQQSTI